MSNLPPDVSDRDCGVYAAEHYDSCPICGAQVDDTIWCEECGAVLDPEEAAAEERFADEAEGWDRGMER